MKFAEKINNDLHQCFCIVKKKLFGRRKEPYFAMKYFSDSIDNTKGTNYFWFHLLSALNFEWFLRFS